MTVLSPYASHRFNPDESNEAWANLNALIPDGVRVLDVGCSTGNFAHMLQEQRGCEVAGIDLSEADIAEARTKFDRAYVLDVADSTAAELLGQFDVIIFADVLEHLTDPRAVLRSLGPLLAPGGRVVYSIPNMAHMSIRLELLRGEFPYTPTGLLDNTHLHFYDRREIEQMFVDGGFAIEVERPVIAELTRPWMASQLRKLGLGADDRFWQHLEETDAFVYQYVGAAVPVGGGSDEPVLRTRLSADRVVRRLAVAAEERAGEAESRASVAEKDAARLRAQLEDTRRELRHLRAFIQQWRSRPLQSLARAVRSRLRRGR